MITGRPAPSIHLSPNDRQTLAARTRQPTAAVRDVIRAAIILLADQGLASKQIARQLDVSEATVSKWRNRFAIFGIKGLTDAARSGRPPRILLADRLELFALACEPLPATGGRTVPTLAEIADRAVARHIVSSISTSHLQRILAAGALHPHRIQMWMHSPDPAFRDKVNAICALYHSSAVVLCVDEKTGMQATSRRYPDRPPVPGRSRRQEFEYQRHGTQALLAAFDIHTGQVLGKCRDRRTGDDLEAFMEAVAAQYPDQQVHIVWDNLNTHRAQWRWAPFNARHGHRFHFHFTPLHASWVNQVELWFSILTRRCLRRASFTGKAHLRSAVQGFIAAWNRQAHPFNWQFRGDLSPA